MPLKEKEIGVETLTFHNPNAVSRIALWANIVAWIVLGLSLITFTNQAYSIIKNWSSIVPSLPPDLFARISAFANLFLDSFTGVVYFLILRGVSLGLNIGQDLFYKDIEDEEIDTLVAVEETA